MNPIPQYPHNSETYFYKQLASVLDSNDYDWFTIVIAYANWQGLSLFSSSIEGHLEKGKKFAVIVGVNNGVTTPDALMYLWYLKQSYKKQVEIHIMDWDYKDSIFHPKMYYFQNSDKFNLIIGSNNLTVGGLCRNYELAASHEGDIKKDSYSKKINDFLDVYLSKATKLTLKNIRLYAEKNKLVNEAVSFRNDSAHKNKPSIKIVVPKKKLPSLAKNLLSKKEHKSIVHDVLTDGDVLSEKPKKLYLQLLKETGSGWQVQLPTATMGLFFRVGTGKRRKVNFFFGDQKISVTLTHFQNNTHRVRLRPVQKVPRPAILVFTRIDDNNFKCNIVLKKNYESVLRDKCVEQTRRGSKFWGIES